jgi:ABC-type transport system involved in multi-copper enzyme maturation permease subunit
MLILKELKEHKWTITIGILSTVLYSLAMVLSKTKGIVSYIEGTLAGNPNLTFSELSQIEKSSELMIDFSKTFFTSAFLNSFFFVLIISIVLGVELVSFEEKNNTFEYLFTRPVSYARILASKFISGIVAIALIVIAPLILYPAEMKFIAKTLIPRFAASYSVSSGIEPAKVIEFTIKNIKAFPVSFSAFFFSSIPYILGFSIIFALALLGGILFRKHNSFLKVSIVIIMYIIWNIFWGYAFGIPDANGKFATGFINLPINSTLRKFRFDTLFLNPNYYNLNHIPLLPTIFGILVLTGLFFLSHFVIVHRDKI